MFILISTYTYMVITYFINIDYILKLFIDKKKKIILLIKNAKKGNYLTWKKTDFQ